jgi:hypothetical protein
VTADLEIRRPELPSAADMSAAMLYAERLANSGLLKPQYRKQPANVLWAIEYGRMIGLSPMAAITGVHVIEGTPSASAALMSALVRRAGHKLRVRGDATSATCRIIRSDDPDFVFEATFTIEEARAAGLAKKAVWQSYPASMLKARAISQCCRDACEEVLFGLHYVPEELGAEVDEEGIPVGEVHHVEQSAPAERSRPAQPVEDEWTEPHHASYPVEIDDVEVVGEEPEPMASDAQKKMLHSLITKKLGPQSDADRHGRMSAFTKRTITSASQLTKTEASQIIDALTKRDDFVPPQPEPGPVPLSIRQTEDEATIAAAQALLPLVEADQAEALEQRFRDLIESAWDYVSLDDALDQAHGAVSDGVLEMDRLKRLMAAGEVKRRDLDAQAKRAQQTREPVAA